MRRTSVIIVATSLFIGACSGGAHNAQKDSSPRTGGAVSGFVDESWFQGRQADFLRIATQNPPSGSLTNAIAHFARAEQDSSFRVDPAAVKAADFDSLFHDFDTLRDTTDFDMLYMLNLWEGYRDHLSPEVRQAFERAMHRFKYWYTEPTTKGVVDNRWYWSENHRIIYHTLEYLAGAAFPADEFTNDGRLGAQHRDTARALIEKWLDEKVRFGWSEWHSDVYYQKDATPLLTLVEFAPDPEIAQRAAMVLDLLLVDIALHVSHGNFGATHGRSYMKDKSTALDQDTFAHVEAAVRRHDGAVPERRRRGGGALRTRAQVPAARGDSPHRDEPDRPRSTRSGWA